MYTCTSTAHHMLHNMIYNFISVGCFIHLLYNTRHDYEYVEARVSVTSRIFNGWMLSVGFTT